MSHIPGVVRCHMLELRGNERRGMGDGITILILFKKPYVPGARNELDEGKPAQL